MARTQQTPEWALIDLDVLNAELAAIGRAPVTAADVKRVGGSVKQ